MKKNTKKNPMVGKKVYTLTITPTVEGRCTTSEVFTSLSKAIDAARREYDEAGYLSETYWKDMKKELKDYYFFYEPTMFT